MKQKYNVVFIGLDENVLSLLHKDDRLNLVATNIVDDFISNKSFNIFDLLFKTIYVLRKEQKIIGFEFILNILFRILFPFSSGLYKKYSHYLDIISSNKLDLIDFENSVEVISYVKKNDIDVFVISNWWILPNEIIFSPKYNTVNIHPSKLPEYRGSVPTLWSLKNNDKNTAVSFMVIDESMDGGKIISQENVKIDKNENSLSLEDKCDMAIKNSFTDKLFDYLNKKIVPKSQDILKASYTAKYFPYMKINWHDENAGDIVDKILLYPHLWPLDICWTSFEDKKILIKFVKFEPKEENLRKNNYGNFKISNFKVRIDANGGQIVLRLFRDLSILNSFKIIFSKNRKFN